MPRGDVAAGEWRPHRFLRLGTVPRQVVLLIFLGRVMPSTPGLGVFAITQRWNLNGLQEGALKAQTLRVVNRHDERDKKQRGSRMRLV